MSQIRISQEAEAIVTELASEQGMSKTRVVKDAVENLHRIVFFPKYEQRVLAELDYYRRRHAELGAHI